LKHGGIFTVRTPNGGFYEACQRLLRDESIGPESKQFLLGAMGYNNLLGFPYLYGHNPATLPRLIEPHGFELGGIVDSELLVFPLPQNLNWVEGEERTINENLRLLANSTLANNGGSFVAPWIEAWFRAV
jgi:hypothetical protein